MTTKMEAAVAHPVDGLLKELGHIGAQYGYRRRGRRLERMHKNGDVEFLVVQVIPGLIGDFGIRYIAQISPDLMWRFRTRSLDFPRHNPGVSLWERWLDPVPEPWRMHGDSTAFEMIEGEAWDDCVSAQIEFVSEWMPRIEYLSDYRNWLADAADPPTKLVSHWAPRLEGTVNWWVARWCVDPSAGAECRAGILEALEQLPDDLPAKADDIQRARDLSAPIPRDYSRLREE